MALDKWKSGVETALAELQSGLWSMPTGPGMIRGKQIRPHSITAANIYVDDLTALGATIGGWTIGATALTATNIAMTSGAANTANIAVGSGSNVAGLNSASAGSDIAFWSGASFANRATALYRVTAAGAVTLRAAGAAGSSSILSFEDSAGASNGYVSSDSGSGGVWLAQTSGYSLELTTSQAILSNDSPSSNTLTSRLTISTSGVDLGHSSTTYSRADSSGYLKAYNRIYPGYGSTTFQSTGYFAWDNANTRGQWQGSVFQFADKIFPGNGSVQANANSAIDYDSTAGGARIPLLNISSQLNYVVTTSGPSGALPSPTKYIVVFNNAGSTGYYIPVFTANNPWAA